MTTQPLPLHTAYLPICGLVQRRQLVSYNYTAIRSTTKKGICCHITSHCNNIAPSTFPVSPCQEPPQVARVCRLSACEGARLPKANRPRATALPKDMVLPNLKDMETPEWASVPRLDPHEWARSPLPVVEDRYLCALRRSATRPSSHA